MQEQLSKAPERRLLIALLRRALFDFYGGKPAEREDAREWLFNDEGNSGVFSFEWVCSHLNFDAKHVLSRLTEERRAALFG